LHSRHLIGDPNVIAAALCQNVARIYAQWKWIGMSKRLEDDHDADYGYSV